MHHVESAGLSDIGKKRTINQDIFFLDDQVGLYVVADGMGGHKAGEVASKMVVEALRDSLTEPRIPAEGPYRDDALSPAAGCLVASIHRADENVRRASLEDDSRRGMGSTVSAVWISDGTIIAANVGDSPIYLIHRDHIEEISVPHTLAAQQAALAENDTRFREKAAHHILTQAIGAGASVSPHICEIQSFPEDILVIGSDGLSNKVTKAEISEAARNMPPDQACRHLVDLANERGGEDNITVLISRIKSPGRPGSPILKSLVHFFRNVFSGFRSKR